MDFFGRATTLAHALVAEVVRPGDAVIDATAGNGYDTQFLCRLVGKTGRVYAFDVQADAIAATKRRLEAADLLQRVTLIHASHETMPDHLSSVDHVKAVMFNLGYLPGSDKSIVTRDESTIAAIDASTRLLSPEGIITIVVYPGHHGGRDEAAAVETHVAGLSADRFSVSLWRTVNVAGNPPYVVGIRRAQ